LVTFGVLKCTVMARAELNGVVQKRYPDLAQVSVLTALML
jgi:hypothetical protein